MTTVRSTTIRLLGAAVLLVAVFGGMYVVRGGLAPPEVDMPPQDFGEMPFVLDEWSGKTQELDSRIAVQIGADTVVNRVYHHPSQGDVWVHVAVFSNPVVGISHTPLYCYQGAGWNMLSEKRVLLDDGVDSQLSASVSTWTQEGKMIRVLYWFELGDHLLYNRYDLGMVRWAMRGRPRWPALIKVLIQTYATQNESDDLARLQSLVRPMTMWMEVANSPSTPPRSP